VTPGATLRRVVVGRPALKVVVAPDSFGGTLSAREAAEAIALGWRSVRRGDDIASLPLADGGEGTLDVVAEDGDERCFEEVADPLGRPRKALWLRREDGSAVVETAEACGLRLLGRDERNPLRTTTYGVGQLLDAARRSGARRIVVGLGGSATVDGGAGALLALGHRLTRGDGRGVKVGARELVELARIEPRWVVPEWSDVDVTVWCDVRTRLDEAARIFGPQKGASPEAVGTLARGLEVWAGAVERDLGGRWRQLEGSGAAGGLGFGLAAGVGAELVPGAAAIADEVGLRAAVADADLVITGEGTLDATSLEGKVVGEVVEAAGAVGVPVVAVVGQARVTGPGLAEVEVSAPHGPGPDPAAEVAAAARRVASRRGVGNPRR
jgi:glycerate 2-kinase